MPARCPVIARHAPCSTAGHDARVAGRRRALAARGGNGAPAAPRPAPHLPRQGNPGVALLHTCPGGRAGAPPGGPGRRLGGRPARLLGRPAPAGAARGRALGPVRSHGDRHRLGGAALLGRLHGRGSGGGPLLRPDAHLRRRAGRAGLLGQPVPGLRLLGAGGALLLRPGRLLVPGPGGGPRRPQGAAHDPPGRLRAAGRGGDAVRAHRQRPLDRSRRGGRLQRRRLPADAGGACRQVGPVPAPHLDPGGDGGAHAGERPAPRRLLREGRRLPLRPPPLPRALARLLGRGGGGRRDRHHAGRCAAGHGAGRPEADARLQHREPDRLHDHRPRHRHPARHHRRPAPLRQPRLLQGRPLPGRRVGAARRRHPRHGPAGGPRPAHALDHRRLADLGRQHDGHPADERLRQQVDALLGGAGGGHGDPGPGRLDRQHRHGLLLRQGDQRASSWAPPPPGPSARTSPRPPCAGGSGSWRPAPWC